MRRMRSAAANLERSRVEVQEDESSTGSQKRRNMAQRPRRKRNVLRMILFIMIVLFVGFVDEIILLNALAVAELRGDIFHFSRTFAYCKLS